MLTQRTARGAQGGYAHIPDGDKKGRAAADWSSGSLSHVERAQLRRGGSGIDAEPDSMNCDKGRVDAEAGERLGRQGVLQSGLCAGDGCVGAGRASADATGAGGAGGSGDWAGPTRSAQGQVAVGQKRSRPDGHNESVEAGSCPYSGAGGFFTQPRCLD